MVQISEDTPSQGGDELYDSEDTTKTAPMQTQILTIDCRLQSDTSQEENIFNIMDIEISTVWSEKFSSIPD